MAKWLLWVIAVALACISVVPAQSSAALVSNGGFEGGTFSGWTVVNQGSGDWFVYDGALTPLNGFRIPVPPEGEFAATTDQRGPGSHVLYQDVALEAGFHHRLTFTVYYRNRNGEFVTPPTLGHNGPPNQQYRVDVLSPSAPVKSVAPGDMLATVFRTKVGDPARMAPTPTSFDLTGFAGTTVRIRFAEVDNQLFFRASVDNVEITSSPVLKKECKKGGWRTFGSSFENQGDCVTFAVTQVAS
jgi:hypothetical protein